MARVLSLVCLLVVAVSLSEATFDKLFAKFGVHKKHGYASYSKEYSYAPAYQSYSYVQPVPVHYVTYAYAVPVTYAARAHYSYPASTYYPAHAPASTHYSGHAKGPVPYSGHAPTSYSGPAPAASLYSAPVVSTPAIAPPAPIQNYVQGPSNFETANLNAHLQPVPLSAASANAQVVIA